MSIKVFFFLLQANLFYLTNRRACLIVPQKTAMIKLLSIRVVFVAMIEQGTISL